MFLKVKKGLPETRNFQDWSLVDTRTENLKEENDKQQSTIQATKLNKEVESK